MEEVGQAAVTMVQMISKLNQWKAHADKVVSENQVTRYDYYFYDRDGAPPICYLAERRENQGPSLSYITESLAREVVGVMIDHGIYVKPQDLLWYEQNKAGDIQKVTFVTTSFNEPNPNGWKALPNRESVTPDAVMSEIGRTLVPNLQQRIDEQRLENQTFTQTDNSPTQKVAEEYKQRIEQLEQMKP